MDTNTNQTLMVFLMCVLNAVDLSKKSGGNHSMSTTSAAAADVSPAH